jgi:hypothetical protein
VGEMNTKIALEKSFVVDDVWLKVNEMQDVCIRHKKTLNQKVLRLCITMQREKTLNPSL